MLKVQKKTFRAGDWIIEPELNSLTRDGTEHHLEPKVMLVLLTLAGQPNRVITKEDLLSAVWPDTFVSEDALTRCISILRRVTADDPHAPRFIQTVPKVGYRLVAAISELPETDLAKTVAAPPIEEIEESPVEPEAGPRSASDPAPAAATRQTRSSRTWFFTLATVVLLLAIAAAARLWFGRSRGSSLASGSFRLLPFTSSAGEQTEPAFSPDGTRIAFVLIPEKGTSRQIYIKQIGNESVQPLHPGSDEQFSPAWSPDGRQIAYLSRSGTSLGIYIADVAANSTARRIFIPQEPSHWEQGALSWSRDGKSLIFPDHTGLQPNSSIFQLNVATGEAHSITTPPPGWEGDLNPAYSPDGKKIAFTRASETAVRDVYWISLADGRLHQLTHDRMNIDSLAWSADSAAVVFSSNRGGKFALWKMGLTQKEPERLPVGAEDAYQPSVGPVRGQLAYAQGSAIWSIVRIDRAPDKNNDRQPAPQSTVLLSSTQQDSAPSLSPDGRYFAIQSLRSGPQEIWISSIASTSTGGNSLRQLTFMGGPLTGSPAWSKSGDRIAFDSRPDGHSHIFVVPAAGGKPRQITFGNENDIVPRWSHDDRLIYFRSNRAGKWQIWQIPSGGGDPQPVTMLDGIVPQESPDGRYLYYTRGYEDGLWRVPAGGGSEETVLSQPPAGYWGYWQITRHGLFYLDRYAGAPSIRVFNPDTKKTTTFANLNQSPPMYAGISVSPAGDFVLMTGERDAGRHITLVEAQP